MIGMGSRGEVGSSVERLGVRIPHSGLSLRCYTPRKKSAKMSLLFPGKYEISWDDWFMVTRRHTGLEPVTGQVLNPFERGFSDFVLRIPFAERFLEFRVEGFESPLSGRDQIRTTAVISKLSVLSALKATTNSERIESHVMEVHTKRRPARLDRASQGERETKKYIEFQLDRATLREVEALARETGCTPFEMSVILMKEGLSSVSGASGASGDFGD